VITLGISLSKDVPWMTYHHTSEGYGGSDAGLALAVPPRVMVGSAGL
jgi:hypothetical protein